MTSRRAPHIVKSDAGLRASPMHCPVKNVDRPLRSAAARPVALDISEPPPQPFAEIPDWILAGG